MGGANVRAEKRETERNQADRCRHPSPRHWVTTPPLKPTKEISSSIEKQASAASRDPCPRVCPVFVHIFIWSHSFLPPCPFPRLVSSRLTISLAPYSASHLIKVEDVFGIYPRVAILE
jgi:hypothetical protein